MVGAAAMELGDELRARGLAPRTVSRYRLVILAAERWCEHEGGCTLRCMDGPTLARYAESLPLTFASRTALRAALGHYWEIIERDRPPLRAIRVPHQPERVCRALDDEDTRLLAKHARARGDKAGFATCLGLYQAMRRSEIAECRWDWFKEPGWLHVTGKGAKTRRIPVHPVIADLMEAQPRESEWLFVGYRGRSVTPTTVWNWIQRVCEDAGLPPIGVHVLRHCSLAHANDGTGDLRAVQSFAGHSKPETTAIYTRASTKRLRAVVASLDY